MQPFPAADHERLGRVIADFAAFIRFDTNAANTAMVTRWIGHVLNRAQLAQPRWWFLENLASTTLAAGVDLVDLRGALAGLCAVWAPLRLEQRALPWIVDKRQCAARYGRSNAGWPEYYALEAGRRLHLWPAPHQAMPFVLQYVRPIDIAIVPDTWEPVLLDGLVGLYGRHWDRDALTSRPAEFEKRFYAGLRRLTLDGLDQVVSVQRWIDTTVASVTAGSASDTATGYVVPASLSGIGAVVIEAGDYLMEVG